MYVRGHVHVSAGKCLHVDVINVVIVMAVTVYYVRDDLDQFESARQSISA